MTSLKPASPDDDLAMAATPAVVRSAGAVLLMAGVFGVLHVVQIYGLIAAIHGPFLLLPPLMIFETVAAVLTGVALARARAWAPWAAIVTSALLSVTATAWFVFALGNGLITLFGMLVPGMATLALLFAIVAKRPCETTSGARQRLEQQGLELGV